MNNTHLEAPIRLNGQVSIPLLPQGPGFKATLMISKVDEKRTKTMHRILSEDLHKRPLHGHRDLLESANSTNCFSSIGYAANAISSPGAF